MDWLFLLFLVIFVVLAVQPTLAMRRLREARTRMIRRLERRLGARVITLIHRQERANIFGMISSRHIDMDDAQAVMHAIRTTPPDRPIAMILHTPGGLVLAATQIARALKAHPGPVTVYVPVFAMSGGTFLALAADKIVMGPFSALGPTDPQVYGFPGASIANVKTQKPASHIHDLTMVLADVSEKAIAELREEAAELMRDRMGEAKALEIADTLTRGTWTHAYPISAREAIDLGLTVSTDLPNEVLELMTLYPQPVRQVPSVETSPAPGDDGQRVKIGPWSF